ncbi:MAG: hypothetical protein GTO18_19465 [Anaerolineales bacterium]|nr:hypothetical protein [Anaerolineales bacterium]
MTVRISPYGQLELSLYDTFVCVFRITALIMVIREPKTTRVSEMKDISDQELRSILKRILTMPDPEDLWLLQAELLERDDETSRTALKVAGAFHSFLRNLESKSASHEASRWGAILATAAVSSIGLQEVLAEQQHRMRRLIESGVSGLLEVGAAVKHTEAWEVESSLVYYEVAWYLYGELWDISVTTDGELFSAERRDYVDKLVSPAVDPNLDDALRSALLVLLFQTALAARMLPLLENSDAD